jgi:endo-beta-N-acetylglucosaminidase D
MKNRQSKIALRRGKTGHAVNHNQKSKVKIVAVAKPPY